MVAHSEPDLRQVAILTRAVENGFQKNDPIANRKNVAEKTPGNDSNRFC